MSSVSTVVHQVQLCWERVATAISHASFRDDASGQYLFTCRAMPRGEPQWHRATDSSAECELGWDVTSPVEGRFDSVLFIEPNHNNVEKHLISVVRKKSLNKYVR